MGRKRELIQLEYQSSTGVRFELDADGWRLVKPRNLGEKELIKARELLDLMAECQPPRDPEDPEPSLQEIGDHVAGAFALRQTHQYFKQK